MSSNYPPGVTGNEPQIAGESHYRACPQSDDWECSDEDYKRIDPYEVRELVLEAFPASTDRPYLEDALHPFRWMKDCCCESIHENLRDDAAEKKQQDLAP